MGRTDVADRDDALPGTLCRAIVEASPLAMAVFRLPQLVAVDANTAFGLLTGIDRSELTGAGWADLPIWEHPEQADRQLLGATVGRPCGMAPVGLRSLSGGRRSTLASSSVIASEAGEFLVISVQDVTEAREAEAALLWQYEQLDWQRREAAAILDAADEAMVLVSPDWRLANANRRFCELIGMPADDVLGLLVTHIRPHLLRAFGDHALADLLEWNHDQTLASPIHLRQLLPEARELELTASDITGGDRAEHGRLFALRDVTLQLEADRLKDEFIATVSHELRTPLTSIAGFVELLLGDTAGPLPAQAERFLGVIQRNVGQLIEQVNELLDFSRLEAGAVAITPAAINLGATLRESAALLAPQIEGRGQTMTVDIPIGLPRVWADGPRVVQIAVNLLSNASKFTPESGAIHLAVSVDGDEIRVDVSDTGIGLSESEQRLIFSRFYRVQTAASRHVPGSGLGLPIARILVERQGGRMWVTSTPGIGSVFSFTLPRWGEQASS